jgi:hypothetical protein
VRGPGVGSSAWDLAVAKVSGCGPAVLARPLELLGGGVAQPRRLFEPLAHGRKLTSISKRGDVDLPQHAVEALGMDDEVCEPALPT